MKLCENTLTDRSERSRASGEVEEQAGRESGGLRLHSTMLKPNSQDATASEEVYESCVVRFRTLSPCDRSGTQVPFAALLLVQRCSGTLEEHTTHTFSPQPES